MAKTTKARKKVDWHVPSWSSSQTFKKPKMKTPGCSFLMFLNKINRCTVLRGITWRGSSWRRQQRQKQEKKVDWHVPSRSSSRTFRIFLFSPQRASEDIGRTCTQQRSSSGDPLVYTLSQNFEKLSWKVSFIHLDTELRNHWLTHTAMHWPISQKTTHTIE